MESVSDILGGSQLLLHLEVDPQLFFESYLVRRTSNIFTHFEDDRRGFTIEG